MTRHRRLNIALAASLTLVLLMLSAGLADAHDMFVRPIRFFVQENSELLVRVLNGTFSTSSNAIARTRVADVSIVGPAGRTGLDTSQWSATGDTSTFHVRTAAGGTYVLGVSTRPNVIAMSADTFNMYLAEDGIPDVLAARRRSGELGKPASERYSKHVKAMIQVGNVRSEHYTTALGYPAEIIPLVSPYSVRRGDTLRVRTLVDGKPAAHQYVLYGGRTPSGGRIAQRNARSDANGVAVVPLRIPGIWYIKFIHMSRMQHDTVDYESKWATLTFEVR